MTGHEITVTRVDVEKKRRIAVLTGGGDCPGMNAIVRAVAKKAILDYGAEIIGIEDGYEGLIRDRHRVLTYEDVSGIITQGGTILGTSNTANPYAYATKVNGVFEFRDVSKSVLANIEKLRIDCLVCVGGDGTLGVADRLYRDGVPVIGIPKTIDNDLFGTDITVGFDTAVSIATEGIDRVHTTAESHHRVMVVEVMGRNAGWLALFSGVAGGGDVVIIPEIPYDVRVVADVVRRRSSRGKKFTIVVIAEGAKPKGGQPVVRKVVKDGSEPVRLGGVSFVLASEIEDLTGIETRALVMGHLLRGGTPSAFDRVLATKLGTKAVDMIADEHYCRMVGIQKDTLVEVPLEEVALGQRKVPLDYQLIRSARSVGTSFGDVV